MTRVFGMATESTTTQWLIAPPELLFGIRRDALDLQQRAIGKMIGRKRGYSRQRDFLSRRNPVR
ncbi:MAG: hypothetical protein ACI9VS_001818, partial [Candidatus Binatia bacterium]